MKPLPNRTVSDLPGLESQHELKRTETLEILEVLSGVRRLALLKLQKTQILFKHLNWKQQEQVNDFCGGNSPLQTIRALSVSSPKRFRFSENMVVPVTAGGSASYLQRVKTARKNILQFGLIQARADELIGTIGKATAVFNHQYKTACRELFPFGLVSKAWRSFRRFFNRPYYSWQELNCLKNLGAAVGFVLKMAEAPVLGVKR